MEHSIDTVEDIFKMLDGTVHQIPWDSFYEKRVRPAPFLQTPDLPDENLVKFLNGRPSIRTALELGCGEGRNAVYMSARGLDVTAADGSQVAIANAVRRAEEKNTRVRFLCGNIFAIDFGSEPYDFLYDSGLFHHLAPHRRITYLELLNKRLKPGGYFGLNCFAWGENCADEVDDWEFYRQRRAGVAFTKDRLITLFGGGFDVLEIRKYDDHVPGALHGTPFLWTCLFQKKEAKGEEPS